MYRAQTNSGVMIIVFSLGLQLQMRPYLHDVLNNMEAASLLCAFFTLSSGVFMFSPNTPTQWRTILTVVIFIANIGFLVYAGLRLLEEAKRQRAAAPPSDGPSMLQKVLIKIGIRKAGSARVPTEDRDSGRGFSAELPALSKVGSVMGRHSSDGENPMIRANEKKKKANDGDRVPMIHAYDSLGSQHGQVTQV